MTKEKDPVAAYRLERLTKAQLVARVKALLGEVAQGVAFTARLLDDIAALRERLAWFESHAEYSLIRQQRDEALTQRDQTRKQLEAFRAAACAWCNWDDGENWSGLVDEEGNENDSAS